MSEPSLFQTLPSTTDDAVLDHLSIEEIICFGKTCKNAHIAMQSYFKRKFKLGDVLSRFFPAEGDVEELRTLMSETGTVISGSTALQFLDRVVYPDSDLDIYVPLQNALRVAYWLFSKGYSFIPEFPVPFPHTVESDIFRVAARYSTPPVVSATPARRGYLRAACVLSFTASNPARKVQIIASVRSVAELILGFHSTCVMNLITHEKAYSLFPRATLLDRRALTHLNRLSIVGDESNEQAYDKWTARGFHLGDILTMGELENPGNSSFAPGPRSIGDGKCLVLPIHPIRDDLSGPGKGSTIEINSFNLAYNGYLQPRFDSWHLNLEGLKYPYVVTGEEANLIMEELPLREVVYLRPVNRTVPNDDDVTFDHDLNRLMRAIRDAEAELGANSGPPESDSEPEDGPSDEDEQNQDSVPANEEDDGHESNP